MRIKFVNISRFYWLSCSLKIHKIGLHIERDITVIGNGQF